MCGSGVLIQQSMGDRHRSDNTALTHRVTETALSVPFQPGVTWMALEDAFPLVREYFHILIASMFIREDACSGDKWEENTATAGHWYGLSWGGIHCHTLGVWQNRSRLIRATFYWWGIRRLLSFVRLTSETARGNAQWSLWGLAFWNPHPLQSFKVALKEMLKEGLLRIKNENGVRMYYPTDLLARRIADAAGKTTTR